MKLDELLEIDFDDPIQQNAIELVEADQKLLDDLVSLRKDLGLTQAEVASRMNVDQSAVARIEAAERDPHLSTLRRYSLALGATVRHEVDRYTHVETGATTWSPAQAAGAQWSVAHGSSDAIEEWNSRLTNDDVLGMVGTA